jgi:hypothetical protein
MISATQLLTIYVNQPMLQYFQRKLPQFSERDLQIQIEETLKFLFMAEECSGAIPVSRELDEIWHYWILQTQEYMSLCERLPAGHYIHHSSNDYEKYFDAEVSERSNLLLDIKMLALYAANFGAFEEERINYWLLAKHLVNKCGWSVAQLNEWLGVSESNQHADTRAMLMLVEAKIPITM